MQTSCPYCRTRYRISEALVDKRVQCKRPDCREFFTASVMKPELVGAVQATPVTVFKSVAPSPPPLPKEETPDDAFGQIFDRVLGQFGGNGNSKRRRSSRHNKRRPIGKDWLRGNNVADIKKTLITIASIVVGILILLLLAISGGVSGVSRSGIVGYYETQDDPTGLLEFRENGRFLAYGASSGTLGRPSLEGEWNFRDNKLVTTCFGMSSFWKVRSNRVIKDDGMGNQKIWTKIREARVSKDTVPGKYSCRDGKTFLDIYRNGTFRYLVKDGSFNTETLVEEDMIKTGEWRLSDNELAIFLKKSPPVTFLDVRENQGPWMEFEVISNGMLCRRNSVSFVKES